MITAEQMVLRSKDISLIKEFSLAIIKIKSVLRYSGKEKVNLLSNRMFVVKSNDLLTTSKNLMDIQTALTSFQLIKILYQTPTGNITERLIEPFALYNWTLAAYCRLRKDFRSFRLDRIKKVDILNECFEPHKMTLQQYIYKFVE